MTEEQYDKLIEGIKECMFTFDNKTVVVIDYNILVALLNQAYGIDSDKFIEDTARPNIPKLFDNE